jgi:hypothetical protein
MGETLPLFSAQFNGSLRIESRPERLTSDAGAIVLRELEERLGFIGWLAPQLTDTRNPALITHPLPELLRTELLMLAQGWRDRDDADALRDDAAFRLAISERKGVSPLKTRPRQKGKLLPRNPEAPDGLASQPTLSRLGAMISNEDDRQVLREGLLWLAARRIKAVRRHRFRHLTIDVDGLPVEVHGHQPGSAHNGHYHARIYHPLVAAVAETGDLLDLRLREGNVHGADGALGFIDGLIDRVEKELCQVAAIRMDAGFPEDELLSRLEERGTPYVARIRNNPVLNRMAEPHLRRPVGRPPAEPRTWTHEMTYQAKSWTRPRRVVLVVMERESELFLHHFWLLTNWLPEQMPAAELLALYRQRGTAEGHFGELMDVLDPALSSSPRPKAHYRGEVPTRRYPSGDSFAQNEVRLLMNALAYNLVHIGRALLEEATLEGWSLRRFRERLLRAAGRILVHGRRVVLVLGKPTAELWTALWRRMAVLHVDGIT